VLDVHVAVKLVRDEIGGELTTMRLLREARATARLAHPGVVRVLEFGRARDGNPFIVMELLQGETLADRLERERSIDPTEAVRLLLPIAEALALAHANGVVHRDVKPENIVLSVGDEGKIQPKLVDFGIVRIRDTDRLTEKTHVVGTPGYAAPEQIATRNVDERSDVWGFSLVLYETVTGTRPFQRESTQDSLFSVFEADCGSLLDLRGFDERLAAIISRGLRVDPTLRWPSMHALVDALTAYLERRDATTSGDQTVRLSSGPPAASVTIPQPRAQSRMRGSLQIAAVMAAMALSLAVGYSLGRSSAFEETAQARRAAAAPVSGQPEPHREPARESGLAAGMPVLFGNALIRANTSAAMLPLTSAAECREAPQVSPVPGAESSAHGSVNAALGKPVQELKDPFE
jgi:eukaryotic-like serine/threonine-protein kinase